MADVDVVFSALAGVFGSESVDFVFSDAADFVFSSLAGVFSDDSSTAECFDSDLAGVAP